MEMKIGERLIGDSYPPFIIAEMSGNHNQSLKRALELVEAAADSGADAIKLQTYTADTLTLECEKKDFLIDDKNSPWYGESLHRLYTKAHTPWNWHAEIMDHAQKHGLICFSSPFDETAVDFLEGLSVPAYKIASFENGHLPLLRRVAQTGKPIIVSTGMATIAEIDTAVKTLRGNGCEQLALLKCTSAYPSRIEDANLKTMASMREVFDCIVGVSDHTLGLAVPITGAALGASIVEKHLTISREEGGVDASFSLEPSEFKQMCKGVRDAWLALGSVDYTVKSTEKESIRFRRSLYASKAIRAGDIFNEDNMRIVRPGYGAEPAFFDVLLGRVSRRDYEEGEPITHDSILD